jgi:hypothetical protein
MCCFCQRYYYLAMIEDAILRFSWTLTVSIGESGLLHEEILRTILASLEVFRYKHLFSPVYQSSELEDCPFDWDIQICLSGFHTIKYFAFFADILTHWSCFNPIHT